MPSLRATLAPNQAPSGSATQLLIDAHVHFHDSFTWSTFLDAARRNFLAERDDPTSRCETIGCLLLAETKGVHAFRGLRDDPKVLRTIGWSVEATDESCSLQLVDSSENRLLLVAGRQIVTRENLEVLALASDDEFEDGVRTEQTIDQVNTSAALPVVAWGFGKWWCRRGAIVRRLLESYKRGMLFIGDNGNRPRGGSRPPIFENANRLAIPVLPGSDPLPFPDHERRVGCYGFVIEFALDLKRPAESICVYLRSLKSSPPVFGQLANWREFLRTQIRAQWHRRCLTRRHTVHKR